MKRCKLIIVLITFFSVIPLFFYALCQNSFAEVKGIPIKGGIYRRPLEFNPKTLDPALSIDIHAVTVIQQIFDGLVQFDKDLNILPAIAKSWKISPDGLTYTFYLREGVKFHNGREVTADDFVYSFTRIIDPKSKSPAAHLLNRVVGFKEFQDGRANYVKGLNAIGKYIFVIKLSEAYAPFLSILGMNKFKVLPKEEIERLGPDFEKSPVGTGSFKFVSMKEGEEIVLEANPDHFEGRPYLDKIVFKIFHGSPREEIFRRFKEGELEDSFIPFQDVEEVVKSKQYIFFQKPILSLRFFGLNTQIDPLKKEKIRKAIYLAIPKEEIGKEVLKGMAHLTDRIIPLGMPGYHPGKKSLKYDTHKARELLREAGHPEGRGIQPIVFWSAAKSELAVKELEMVKNALSKIGISIDVQYETNWPKFQELLSLKKAPMFMYAWYADFPDPDNFLGILFHSKSKYNYWAYHNPEVDRLLDKAKTERDYLKRMEMYRKIEEIVLDDAPIVPMVNHLFQMAYQPYVRGVEVNALGGPYIPMKKIWLKKD
jgi:peptide/nickel transport system substrate-binding protein/oligopeptide transport system substrate-binding protein